jgi:hypothetical protein
VIYNFGFGHFTKNLKFKILELKQNLWKLNDLNEKVVNYFQLIEILEHKRSAQPASQNLLYMAGSYVV